MPMFYSYFVSRASLIIHLIAVYIVLLGVLYGSLPIGVVEPASPIETSDIIISTDPQVHKESSLNSYLFVAGLSVALLLLLYCFYASGDPETLGKQLSEVCDSLDESINNLSTTTTDVLPLSSNINTQSKHLVTLTSEVVANSLEVKKKLTDLNKDAEEQIRLVQFLKECMRNDY